MPINNTVILNEIYRRLGVSNHELELSDEGVLETIKNATLPVFSNYFPFNQRITLNPVHDKVEGHYGVYWIRTELDVLGVNKMLINNLEANQSPVGSYYNDPFSQTLQNSMASMTLCPATFAFLPPNKIEIFPKSYYVRNMLVELRCIHPEHLQTIPLSLMEEFKNLAFYDVCMSIYPLRGRYTNIGTSFGNIDLFMNQLEEANSKREELLEKWSRNYFKAPNRKKIFVV